MLREIGNQLDRNIFPLVENGGIVALNKTAPHIVSTSEERNHDKQQRQNRSQTRSRTRASRREGETRKHGEASNTSSVIRSSLQQKYENELDSVKEAYPGTIAWKQKEGIWLLSHSKLLPNAQCGANFLCAIPFDPVKRVRTWGFWDGNIWIGPRHTNFPDGSICAFEPSDGTWLPGNSIITLLDIYTLWVVRQLHLLTYGRWPGAQVAHYAYERLTELKNDELCGCGSLSNRYGECCQPNDIRRNQIADAIKYISIGGTSRKPPEAVLKFITERNNPPLLSELLK